MTRVATRLAPALAIVALSSLAGAQAPPPAMPPTAPAPGTYPPGAYPPSPYPPGAYPPPYGYPYPPPYGYPPPYAAPYPPPAPPEAWKAGDPIPAGYHVEERPRSGLVTAGIVVTAVPYAVALMGAAAADFRNESVWLFAPVVGPWLTIGRRSYACSDRNDQTTADGLRCFGEVFLVMGLVADGVMQAAGGTLLLIGVTSTHPELVPGPSAFRVAPTRVGSGYGLRASGTF